MYFTHEHFLYSRFCFSFFCWILNPFWLGIVVPVHFLKQQQHLYWKQLYWEEKSVFYAFFFRNRKICLIEKPIFFQICFLFFFLLLYSEFCTIKFLVLNLSINLTGAVEGAKKKDTAFYIKVLWDFSYKMSKYFSAATVCDIFEFFADTYVAIWLHLRTLSFCGKICSAFS